jgi:hypothetical protein
MVKSGLLSIPVKLCWDTGNGSDSIALYSLEIFNTFKLDCNVMKGTE